MAARFYSFAIIPPPQIKHFIVFCEFFFYRGYDLYVKDIPIDRNKTVLTKQLGDWVTLLQQCNYYQIPYGQ